MRIIGIDPGSLITGYGSLSPSTAAHTMWRAAGWLPPLGRISTTVSRPSTLALPRSSPP